jgi:methylated-DNA-protein-cysteine methyltransferase-like protein
MIDKINPTAYAAILAAVSRIPYARVATYGQIALLAGYPRAARLTGLVLRSCPSDTAVPWHRVINARGRLSFPTGSRSYRLQRSRLQQEGVLFNGERIDLARYQWQAPDLDRLLWQLDPKNKGKQ